jgi:hypothetical protein
MFLFLSYTFLGEFGVILACMHGDRRTGIIIAVKQPYLIVVTGLSCYILSSHVWFDSKDIEKLQVTHYTLLCIHTVEPSIVDSLK